MSTPSETPETRLTAVVARLAEDDRVLGAARLRAPAPGPTGRDRAFDVAFEVACRYDAHAALFDELWPALATCLGPGAQALVQAPHAGYAVGPDGRTLALRVTPSSQLKPCAAGVGAEVLVDRHGLLEQWVRWSAGRPEDPPDPPAEARAFEDVLDRADRPVPDAGLLLACDSPADADATLEQFLLVADGEGFAGDRFLFERARDRLGAAARTIAVFELGFCLPTFDAVSGRFGLGPPIGGCKVPLAPGVHVGVAVTARDELEFWAGPTVRAADGRIAATHDDGERVILPRSTPKDAFVAAFDDVVDGAFDRLPDFLRRARGAGREPLEDVNATLRGLSLPKSYRDRTLAGLDRAEPVTRLRLALALTRAGERGGPVPAMKFAWAAGRLLAAAAPADDLTTC